MSDKTPRTSAAIAAVVDAGGELEQEHRPLVELCRALERELAALQAGHDRYVANITEALNSGDGSYRP